MRADTIKVMKKGFELFLSGDIPGFIGILSDDIQWDHRGPEIVPLNRLFRGKAEVGEFFGILDEVAEILAFEPREFFADGDRGVALGVFRFRVRPTGKEWESDWAMAFTVRDGLVTHWRVLFDTSAEEHAFQP